MIRIRFKGFIAAGYPKATSQLLHGTPLGGPRTLRYGVAVKSYTSGCGEGRGHQPVHEEYLREKWRDMRFAKLLTSISGVHVGSFTPRHVIDTTSKLLQQTAAMTYAVKEIFYTLQGEGWNAGRPAVFCRFTGCNLWSGREADRATAICRFCDTDFVGIDGIGGGRFAGGQDLARAIAACWPKNTRGEKLVVLTGGEPLLQTDEALISALHQEGFEIAVETNGTIVPPTGIDWLCVSPKSGAELAVTGGHEIKLVLPQPGAAPELFEALAFEHYFLQPMDGPERVTNAAAAVRYCLAHPLWRLSLQTHKILGIP